MQQFGVPCLACRQFGWLIHRTFFSLVLWYNKIEINNIQEKLKEARPNG